MPRSVLRNQGLPAFRRKEAEAKEKWEGIGEVQGPASQMKSDLCGTDSLTSFRVLVSIQGSYLSIIYFIFIESNILNEHWEAIEMVLVFLTIEHFTGYFCVQIDVWLQISVSVFFRQGCLVTGVLVRDNFISFPCK